MACPSNHTILTSAQRSAGSGYTNYINGRSSRFAMVVVYITAQSGTTQTLDITLLSSPVDPAIDDTKWRTVYQEQQIKNTDFVGGAPWIFGGHIQEDWTGYLKVAYTVGGTVTPKLTFSVNLELK